MAAGLITTSTCNRLAINSADFPIFSFEYRYAEDVLPGLGDGAGFAAAEGAARCPGQAGKAEAAGAGRRRVLDGHGEGAADAKARKKSTVALTAAAGSLTAKGSLVLKR